jgi:PST family polysaccharide transporter
MNKELIPGPTLAQKAARGAVWTVLSSIGGRAFGVLGTLIMTRFLHPGQIGEVSVAAILAMSANWISIWGFGQYTVVKGIGDDAKEVTWHATVAYAVLGALSLGAIALFGSTFAGFLDAPGAAAYIPVMALAVYIKRLAAVPERTLTRKMDFRASGMANLSGELAYTIVALTLAAVGYGGWSIVIANVVQSTLVVVILIRAAGFASWATPTRLKWSRIKDMLKYGMPIGVQMMAHHGSRYWDNLTISHFFGTGATGAYNMAYNLADIPAIQVGEQIALVLMPSMASLPPARRPRVLERSTAILSLIIFPLAVGLALVARPLISVILPAGDWQEVAPLLSILACLSVFRPITWVLSAYLEAEAKTTRLMFLEVGKVAVLFGGMILLAPYGVRAASFAVGLAFGVSAIAGVMLVMRQGPSPKRLLSGFLRPLFACLIMSGVALCASYALTLAGVTASAIHLVMMIAVGAATYVCMALTICRETALDLLAVIRRPKAALVTPPSSAVKPLPADPRGPTKTAVLEGTSP